MCVLSITPKQIISEAPNLVLLASHVDANMQLATFYKDQANRIEESIKEFKNIMVYEQIYFLVHFNIFRTALNSMKRTCTTNNQKTYDRKLWHE